MHLFAEVNLKVKEEELNMVIDELRKNFASVQVQLAKEQTEKLVRELLVSVISMFHFLRFSKLGILLCKAANESLGKEREARIAVESLQAAITEELAKTQGELQTANQRVRKSERSVKEMFSFD